MSTSSILNQALTAHRSGDLARATALYAEAAAAAPNDAKVHYAAGLAALQVEDFTAAKTMLSRAAALDPARGSYAFSHAIALQGLGDVDGALAEFERTLRLEPGNAEAWARHANVLAARGNLPAALESYDRAIALDARHVSALNNRGHVLRVLKRLPEALASLDAALAVKPDFALAHKNRASILQDMRRFDDAFAAYERAIAIAPDYADALSNYADLLLQAGRHDEAISALREVVARRPDFSFARGYLLHTMMRACDWEGLDELGAAIDADIDAGRPSGEPFGYQAFATSEQRLRGCAEIFCADRYPPLPPVAPPAHPKREKMRIGYLCGEFRDHATSMLMAGVFEAHDRSHFETFAFDNGWDDASALRRRIAPTFSELVDIRSLHDGDAAEAVAARGIDILVNLNGYFGYGRQGVFARRPAPIQVNFLGFPGTIGAPYIDYLIADRVVIPPASRAFYTEAIAYLPGCYQPNDHRRPIAPETPSRVSLGLPAGAFVYCCFNNNYKITPATFAGWMRILAGVPQAVLWLLADNPTAQHRLQTAARAHGIDPGRLIFAQRMPADRHLARHRAADLFLDTLPYNAHTTAADALWAGLPLLTCRGSTFPGRVAASLLTSLGLADLIADNPAAFEERAMALAHAPDELASLRRKLARAKSSARLFDTPQFTHDLEALYRRMDERCKAGLPPAALD